MIEKQNVFSIKLIRLLSLVLLFACSYVSPRAQDMVINEESLYFSIDEMPDAIVWLPAPPDTLSPRFAHDVMQYLWGKQQRLNNERARMAIDHAAVDMAEMSRLFSAAFGMEISPERTPAIFRVLTRGVLTVRLAATKPKNEYMRIRPYCRFNEPTLIPEEEEELRTTGSYPSGHTVRGWAMALILCEINPDAQDDVMLLGYEWGQSRVIAGFHWQSDVDASRMIAAAAYARLHTSPEYLSDIKAAREEYIKLSSR